MSAREKGAKAVGAGLLCWAVNVGLVFSVGMYGPTLVILGALGIWAGAVLLVWGDGYAKMPAAQKVPAALISLAVTAGTAFLLLQWIQGFAER